MVFGSLGFDTMLMPEFMKLFQMIEEFFIYYLFYSLHFLFFFLPFPENGTSYAFLRVIYLFYLEKSKLFPVQ